MKSILNFNNTFYFKSIIIKIYLSPSFNLTQNFGYPITTKYTWLNLSHFDRFSNNVMVDMIDLDKMISIKSKMI